MKVTHLSISDSQSGSSIAAYRLHSTMRKHGIDSRMLVLCKTKDDCHIQQVSFIDRYLLSKVGLYTDKILRYGIDSDRGSFSFSMHGLNISKYNLIKDATIIYLHWINGGFLSITDIKDLIDTKKSIILVTHDMWAFTGGCHQSFGCNRYESLCSMCPFFPSRNFIDIVQRQFNQKRRILGEAQNLKVLTPSSSFYNAVLKSAILTHKDIHLIPHLLDDEIFKNIEGATEVCGIPIPRGKHVILFGAMGGKDNPYKGWSYFVEAIDNLPNEIKDNSVIVLFGYEFSQTEISRLKFHAISVGIVNEEREMAKLYSSADVYVFPSLHESFGQTVVEAMSCDTPVVGFDVGAVGDFITHQKNGYVARYRDALDLADGIRFILLKAKNSLTPPSIAIRKKIQSESIIESHKSMWGSDRIIANMKNLI